MPIELDGLSDRRSTSRMGHIRLGKKAKTAKGKEYPEKLDYFLLDPDDENLLPRLQELFGEKPKRLSIMFVSGDRELIFPQYLMKFGKSGLICKGTGGVDDEGNPKPVLFRVDPETGEVPEDLPPCDPANCADYQSGRCKRLASLCGFILCDYPNIRTWQINTTSKISIENLNSRFDELENVVASVGRPRSIAGVPVTLSISPRRVRVRDKAGELVKGKQTIFVMDLDLDTERLRQGGPTLAFLGRLGVAAPDVDKAPDGLYTRSQVEEGADPVSERIEMAEEQKEQEAQPEDDILTDLPEDIVQGLKILGLTLRQVRILVKRFVDEDSGELTDDGRGKLLSYLSGLADLKTAGDDASFNAVLKTLDLDEMEEAKVVEEEREKQVEASTDSVQESAAALGLDI